VPSLAALLVLLLAVVALPGRAMALKPIVVDPEQSRIEITKNGELYDDRGDSLQVETAPAADGMTGRIAVTAKTPGTNPNWIVFALTNQTDKPIERWLTAERYNIIGSGAIWPDLDAKRIEAVTPSIGYVPERIKSDRADIFRITLEPGQTITYVAELSSDRVARVYLWKPVEYELASRDRLLFNGIMLGLTGLLAIFLTAIFAANHKAIFPSAALVSWCVLAYLCVDFGFFHKMFALRPEDNAVYRAASESAVAASLVIFLSVFLRIAFWHNLIRMLFTVWMIAQLTLVAVAVIDPRLASTFARTSFLVIGGVGGAFTLFLAMRGQDRALSLIPTWILFLIWIFAASMTLTGKLSGDIVVSALVAGLVLILVLIGFTVTQFAFKSLEPLYGTAPSELQLRALAVDGAGSAVWEWNARRDEIKVSPVIEASLGLSAGELSTKVDEFMKHLHPADRDRFRLILWSMQERTWAKIRTDFRMRHADNSYRWFELEAASVPNSDARALRCVGLMRDVTDAKRAHERLLHDAVHDSLTGLPNRELMLDRLNVAVLRAKQKEGVRPSVFFIDIDKFKSVNVSFGLVVGDSLLLTVARRLQSNLGPQDTLARVGGDQFAILLLSEQAPQELASLAERLRRSLRAPIKIAGQEIVLTGSLGIAVYDGSESSHLDLYKEAEIAMYRAKRGGADRIEIFRPDMRADRDDRITIESDLRKALTKNQIRVLYQPIIYLPTEELAGFEALVRWEHPKHGMMNPVDFVPVAEESDLIVRLGSHVLLRAAQEAARWQRELPRDEDPLFVSVNVSSRQIFRQNLIQEIRHILGRNIVPKGSLRLEITESLVMENPEQATEILEWLRGAGAELALDDFGTGYSSLAYLHRFPFDTIKVDRALVQSSGSSNGTGAAIVRSIVALAHELGKKVVAEGVENPEDVAFLRSIGCQYAQGFYYGEPMSDKDVMQLLKMVRSTENKLRPRGFFRAKSKPVKEPKGKKKLIAASAQSGQSGMNDGADAPPMPPPGADLPPAPPSGMMANSTVRPRTRAMPPPVAPVPPIELAPPGMSSGMTPPPPPSPISAALLPMLEGASHAAAPPHQSPSPVSQALLPLLVGNSPGQPPHAIPEAPPPAPMPFVVAPPVPVHVPPMQPMQSMPPAPPASHAQPPPVQQSQPPPVQAPAHAPAPPVQAQPAPSPVPAAARQPAATQAPAPQPPAAPAPAAGSNGGELDPDVMVAALKEAAARQDALRAASATPPARQAAEPAGNGADTASNVAESQQANGSAEDPETDGKAAGNGQRKARLGKRPAKKAAEPARPTPDFSGLPPAMAQSLARLAGVPWPPQKTAGSEEQELESEGAGGKKSRNG
jgi:diguanylate cyclase (GGDEF)-like protein/PAS domain S-box-containing protein